MASTLSEHFQKLKGFWNVIAGFTLWIVAVSSSFLLPPPGDTIELSSALQHKLAIFVAAIAIGLGAVPILSWSCKRHTWSWWKFAACIFTLSLAVFVCYEWLLADWTCAYNHRQVIVGSDSSLTPQATKFVLKYPHDDTPERLLLDFPGGKADDIWLKNSILSHCIILFVFYVLLVPLFALSAMAVLQAVYCKTSNK